MRYPSDGDLVIMLVLRVVWSVGLVTHRHLGCGNGSDAQTVPRRPSWGQGSNEIVLTERPALVGQRVNVRVHSCRQALYYQLGRLP